MVPEELLFGEFSVDVPLFVVLFPDEDAPGPTPITTLDATSSALFLLIDALGPSKRTV